MILIFLNMFQLLYSKLCTNISSTLSPSLFRNNSSMPRRQTMKSSAILRPWRHLCNDLSEGHYIKSYKACSFLFVRSTTDFWNLSPNYGEFPMVGKCKEDICQDVMTQHGKHHPWVQSGWGGNYRTRRTDPHGFCRRSWEMAVLPERRALGGKTSDTNPATSGHPHFGKGFWSSTQWPGRKNQRLATRAHCAPPGRGQPWAAVLPASPPPFSQTR